MQESCFDGFTLEQLFLYLERNAGGIMSDRIKMDNIVRSDLKKKELGIYIHIPFCVRKCDYCDFLSAPASEGKKIAYVDALIREIRSYKGRMEEYTVPTLFFGGGTPSSLEPGEISRILEALDQVFCMDWSGMEATLEANPGTVTEEKLTEYKRVGINRLSFGLQSTEEAELRTLGRIHVYQEFLDNYRLARELSFCNINVDLMSALPNQTVSAWETSLHRIAELSPEHISAYSLIIEEGTHFYERYKEGAPDRKELPDEDTDRTMYARTKKILKQYGYERYEISNYAKTGYECRHNNSYWIGTEYLGLGLGAASLLDNTRFSNETDLNSYINLCNQYQPGKGKEEGTSCQDVLGIRRNITVLTQQQRMEEFMFLGLRRMEGVSRRDFLQRFSVLPEEIFGDCIKELEEKKLIRNVGDWIQLTEYGIDISNYVLSSFLLD
jgi:oxygen-independent coproporphyrinogen-3 oxidase